MTDYSVFTSHSFTNFILRYIHWAPEAENTVILYGQIGSRKFAELHNALKAKASKGLIKYIVRHYLGAEANTRNKVSLLGVDSLWGDCTFIPADWGS